MAKPTSRAKKEKDRRKQVDAFLAAKKTLGGNATWQHGNRPEERRALWPVLVDGGTVGATLQVTAYPEETELRFTISLCWPECVWRLDHDPSYKRHRNPLVEVQRGVLEPSLSGPHYHPWEDNRSWVKGKNANELPCARRLPRKMTWKQAMRWFCGQTRIQLDKDQMLEFPPRERLL